MRTATRRRLTGAAAAAAALTATALFVAPTPVSASTASAARTSSAARILANSCNLPTSARPNSTFIQSFWDCNDCKKTAAYDHNTFGGTFYCTYNPSNRATDEHRQY
ncbi:hypothetical protein ABZU32_11700 [Sphaerisporangium sp. NPDC005288]|uniref:Twin-arginine translocation signal domain-containing protein n=1 Tax=Sphaerisporangium rhizosphaerae TaxID=2269375 RepID=A0ABW2NTM7_9ACTN